LIVTVPEASLLERGGVLADVAPTVLDLLGIEQPLQMTGRSLLKAR
jgi:2,3-bisphosphoglycerate-independent phosphoglycerate mutase